MDTGLVFSLLQKGIFHRAVRAEKTKDRDKKKKKGKDSAADADDTAKEDVRRNLFCSVFFLVPSHTGSSASLLGVGSSRHTLVGMSLTCHHLCVLFRRRKR